MSDHKGVEEYAVHVSSTCEDDEENICLAKNTSEMENIPENDESRNDEENFEDCQELSLNQFFQDVQDEAL